MVFKYTSLKEVIAKVFADLKLNEETHPISDFIEWGAEALDKIGAISQYIVKVTGKEGQQPLYFDNYQAALPTDLIKIIQVAYSSSENGSFYPMRYGTNSFDNRRQFTSEITEDENIIAPITTSVQIVMDLFNLDYENALDKINTEPETRSYIEGLIVSNKRLTASEGNTISSNDLIYVINPGYLKMNVKSGYLMMSYIAIPMDEDQYPLIPDMSSFKEAIYWYINMKLKYPEWATGRLSDRVYYHAETKWRFYRGQAYAEALMPSTSEQMESIKNTWIRLIPELNEHSRFFGTLGQSQNIYNQTNN
jgi:hypothetical protein